MCSKILRNLYCDLPLIARDCVKRKTNKNVANPSGVGTHSAHNAVVSAKPSLCPGTTNLIIFLLFDSTARRWASSQDGGPLDPSTALARPEELEQRNKLSGKITVPVEVNLGPISGVPEEQLKERRVRIHIPPKNAMQSGTDNINTWQIEFDNRERWENPLMGWAST